MMLFGGNKATPTGEKKVAVLASGLSILFGFPLPARLHTVPRRSSLQHEYVALLTWSRSVRAAASTSALLSSIVGIFGISREAPFPLRTFGSFLGAPRK